MYKELKFNEEARSKILKGVNTVADAVASTLGPRGQNVIFEDTSFPIITKDGVTVAQQVFLEDKFENMGVMLTREAAEKTNRIGGDGPQPLYSKVLTPNGWVTMGDIETGMKICGSNGTVQTVLGVFPKGEKEVYEVEFSNNRVVECCEDHLWSIKTNDGTEKVMTTGEILDSGIYRNVDGYSHYKYYTPVSIAEFNKKELPIDPYTLGLLIGDGSLSGTGQIELSLGLAKEHVIGKIKLPEGASMKVRYIDNKNYFRIKITGLKESLTKLGLYGTKSDSKFIPLDYLYNSKENRLELLQGLVDTDGYVNSRGLVEYSTVSKQLNDDIVELFRGLGRRVHSYLMERKNNESYSNKSIYRISELMGYKFGDKIIDIRKTGKMEEMQCIKVSNPDSIYFTDNYIMTHNTTSTVVILQNIIQEGFKYIASGMNPIFIKRGMEASLSKILEKLSEIKKNINTREDRLNIATISANNDKELGELIVDVIDEIGENGVVSITTSNLLETEVEYLRGTKLDSGYKTPIFIDDHKSLSCTMNKPVVIMTTDEITQSAQLVPLFDKLLKAGKRDMLLFADEIDGQALAFIIQNYIQGKFRCVPVKMPSFGAFQKDIIQDFAKLVEANVLGEAEGKKITEGTIEDCGKVEKAVINRDKTMITGGNGDVSSKIEEIETLLKSEKDHFRIEKLKDRLAKLTGKAANIKVGGASDTEQTEIKYRIEDALNATKSAIEEGIVEGAGTALLRSSNIDFESNGREYDAGFKLVLEAAKAPFKRIIKNGGENADAIVGKVLDGNDSYNSLTMSYENLFESGVIDPAKVVREELTNAVSTAGILLTSSVAIASIEEKK